MDTDTICYNSDWQEIAIGQIRKEIQLSYELRDSLTRLAQEKPEAYEIVNEIISTAEKMEESLRQTQKALRQYDERMKTHLARASGFYEEELQKSVLFE